MPTPSKSALKKRKQALIQMRQRIGQLPPAADAAEQQRRDALITRANDLEAIVQQQMDLADEINQLNKDKKQPGADQAALDQEIQNRGQQIAALEPPQQTPTTGADSLDVIQWCDKAKQDMALEKQTLRIRPTRGRLVLPAVPPTEQSTADRIQQIENTAEDKGASFEAKAARYNQQKGHLGDNDGDKISRSRYIQETAAGKNGTEQMAKLVCGKCGRYREVDHVAEMESKTVTVEVKNKKSLSGDKDQMKENAAYAKKNDTLAVYKVPKGQDAKKDMIEGVFEEQGAKDRLRVIFVE
ncbi:MAG: hypothetical protein R3F37_18530 [Candidatus Competibacteraceae bacterium]